MAPAEPAVEPLEVPDAAPKLSDPVRSSFVIATRNRPHELIVTIRSLVRQTVLPAELCIVDSSEETPVRAEIEQLCAEVGLALDYFHPAPKGLTVQRNVGIERTKGDPVFFIDDDVWLAPDVHEVVLKEYDRWGPELGGIRATPIRGARPGRHSILWRRLFGMGGWWPEASGRMRAGFFVEGVSDSAGVRKLDYFNGWFMSYRREVFDLERFDEALSGYGYQEDIDFSYRVRKHGYTLLQTPDARVDHFKTTTNRMKPYDLQRMNLGNQFYLHRKLMPQTFKNKLALWWALVGLFTLNVGKSVQQRNHGFITGLLVGAWEQARGRGLIDPAEMKK
ncbi:MAG: glycosyltransferase [Actinomycetota bacterium]|nr:glycosyltransferase [Actinomycetota bacterium]